LQEGQEIKLKSMIALITGATAGFGKAIAYKFAQHGYDLILTGRRKERLDDIEKEITSVYGKRVITLNFDVRSRRETEGALNNLPYDWKEVDVLINNAGLASGLSTIQDGDIDDWETMIDTNVKGLLYVSRIVLPWLVKRNKGHVINIGSVAGKKYTQGVMCIALQSMPWMHSEKQCASICYRMVSR
jgi:3-hydroxy acid dehydrogenase / malonic semialdehyde reductase